MFSFHVGTTMETFYPVSDSSHDMQTIINTAQFVSRASLDKTLHYFEVGNHTIALKTFRGITFVVVSKYSSPNFLATLLQQVRSIAVFLFGYKFNECMCGAVPVAYQTAFSHYMDIYLDLLEKEPLSLFGGVQHAPEYTQKSKQLMKHIPSTTIPINLEFVECILFTNHKVSGRLSSGDKKQLSGEDLFRLSLFERAEFSEPGDPNPELIDPNYVTSVNPPNVIHRAGYFTIGGTTQRCSIAATRMGPNSSQTALFITQNAKANERRDLVMNVLGIITAFLNVKPGKKPPVPACYPPTLVHTIVINRSTGECFESSILQQEKSKKLLESILKVFANKSADAIPRGYISYLWNDSLFDFCYELRFEDDKGVFREPIREIRTDSSVFTDGKVLYYNRLADELFGPVDNITVYETYSIYLETEQQKDIVTISRHFCEEMIRKKSIFIEKAKSIPRPRKSLSAFTIKQAHHKRQGSLPAFNILADNE